MTKKVVSFKNLPAKLPFIDTVVLWLLLDRYSCLGWVKGCAWTLMALVWIALIVSITYQKQVNLKELEQDKE